MDDAIKTADSLEKLGFLNWWCYWKVRKETEKQEDRFLGGSNGTYGYFIDSTYDLLLI